MAPLLIVHHTPALTIMGEPSKSDLEACWELGATVAVSVAP